MPIDIATLASTVVTSFLWPYAKEGLEKIYEKVTGQLSETAAKHVTGVAEEVWQRVKSVFSSSADKGTLEQFEKFPDQGKPLLEAVLKDKLSHDPQLVKDLEELVERPSPEGSGDSVKIIASTVGYVDLRHGQVSGNAIVGGFIERIERGSDGTGDD